MHAPPARPGHAHDHAPLIVRGSWRLVRGSVDILLEAAPARIAPHAVRAQLAAAPGVVGVHALHVWTVTSVLVAMRAHPVVPDATAGRGVRRGGARLPPPWRMRAS